MQQGISFIFHEPSDENLPVRLIMLNIVQFSQVAGGSVIIVCFLYQESNQQILFFNVEFWPYIYVYAILDHKTLCLTATTEIELKDAKKEIENILMEKDGIITELQLKIDTMESAYETLLHVCKCRENVSLSLTRSAFLSAHIPHHIT